MIGLVLYATVAATLLGLAAARAEAVLRDRGLPSRWAWAASLTGSLGLGAWALLRPAAAWPGPATEGAWDAVSLVLVTEFREVAAVAPGLVERADGVVVAVWVAASLLLGGALMGGLLRLARRARTWVPGRVAGTPVLLSEDFGPAVVGVRAPRVVLPRWLLAMDPERLRLVVWHEEEHRRSGDVLLLLAGCLAVVAAPWNLALWWQLHRLRGAVEMDCDARVLGRGAPAALYGGLLLDVGGREVGLPLPVAALSRPPSLLERRLKMIVRRGKRSSVGSALGAAAVAGVLVVAACETPMPTAVRPVADETRGAVAPRVESTVVDRREAEVRAALENVLEMRETAPLYEVDGERVPDITGLEPSRIQAVEVLKGAAAARLYGEEAQGGVVRITTGEPSASATYAPSRTQEAAGGVIRLRSVEERARMEQTLAAARDAGIPSPGAVQGIAEAVIYLDGERYDGKLESIDRETIERIEVVKPKDGQGRPSIHITRKR